MRKEIGIRRLKTRLILTGFTVITSGCGGSGGASVVPAKEISVSVSVVPSSVSLGGTSDATATVMNDGSNQGVTWALTQGGTACSSACGTLSSQNSMSGNPINYTAPPKMPADTSVTITAFSVADPTRSGSTKLTLTPSLSTVTLVPSNLKFSNTLVGQSTSAETTLTNSGNLTLKISNIKITQNEQDFSETDTCGTAVGPAASCTITVTFTPQTSGFKSGDLLISDTAVGSPQDVHLTGKGKKNMTSAAIRSALTKSTVVSAPATSGPNRVGTREMDLIDFSREDPFARDGSPRELLVRFWYPAQVAGGCTPAPYTASKVWNRFSELVGVHLPTLKTNSCSDAPVMDSKHPIVIFTPGYTGTMTDYTFLFEDLASRGFVVASVDHTYEATVVEFPDGRLANSVLGSYLGGPLRGDMSTMAFAVSVRLRDLQFLLEELEKKNAHSGNVFSGKLDTSRIALAGHSMGGVTTLLSLEVDSRFKAAVVIDSDFSKVIAEPASIPVLILGMGRRQWAVEECSLWDALQGPRLAVNLLGAEHMTPTDAIWIAKGAIAPGDMGADKSIAALRDYVAAFLGAHLRNEPWDPLLLGATSKYPGVTVTRQNQALCEASQ